MAYKESPVARLILNTSDMGKIRLAAAPAPLVEIAASIRSLQQASREEETVYGHLRTTFPAAARPLLDIIPASGPIPLFIKLLEPEPPAALNAAAKLSTRQIAIELHAAFNNRRMPRWLRALAAGDTGARDILAKALASYFTVCLYPYWPHIKDAFEFSASRLAEAQLWHGSRAALRTLHPTLRWMGDALEVNSEADRDLAPGGRGILLMPTALWHHPPLIEQLPDGTALIVYGSGVRLPTTPGSTPATSEALAGLVGYSRARILLELRAPCGTTELARRINKSIAVTSQHTAVLRQAGLISTVRRGRAVQHLLTRRGRSMLYASPT